MPRGILERLADGVVLGDGGYLLELEKRGYVQAGPFTPEVVLEHPEALVQLHREFLRAGAEVMQTMTSGRFRHLPVVRHGELLGLVSIGDVVKARLEEATHETEALKAYIVAG